MDRNNQLKATSKVKIVNNTLISADLAYAILRKNTCYQRMVFSTTLGSPASNENQHGQTQKGTYLTTGYGHWVMMLFRTEWWNDNGNDQYSVSRPKIIKAIAIARPALSKFSSETTSRVSEGIPE